MQVPIWLLALLVSAIVLLALMLWSARAQRKSRVDMLKIDRFQEMLPSISGLTGGWFVAGNTVEILQNGDGFFPRLLQDFAAAERSIHLESYAWWKGEICEETSKVLAERAAAGVEVRVLLDALGANLGEESVFDRMRDAGVRLEFFHPIELRALGRLNQRTHRKEAIVDGTVAFVFSHGFAQEWMGSGDQPDSWRDTGARLTGPVVGRVQAVFAGNWMEETGEIIAGDEFFPALEETGDVTCQVVASTPSGNVSPASILHKLMVASANHELLIQNPYFCPDEDMTRMLIAAAHRGVKVRVMVPGRVTDSRIVQHAGHHQFSKLLRAGIEMLEHRRTLLHQKVLIVDGSWSHLGSTNLDERSFDINAEISLGILDEGVASELHEAFEKDAEHCRVLSYDLWHKRSTFHRVLDGAAYLIHEQL